MTDTHARTHTHTQPFNGPFSGTTWVGRYQKGKSNLDFTEAKDSDWQWQQLGHMQVCTSLQTDNHASTPPLSFFTDWMPFLPPNQQRQSTESMYIYLYMESRNTSKTWKRSQASNISPRSAHFVLPGNRSWAWYASQASLSWKLANLWWNITLTESGYSRLGACLSAAPSKSRAWNKSWVSNTSWVGIQRNCIHRNWGLLFQDLR